MPKRLESWSLANTHKKSTNRMYNAAHLEQVIYLAASFKKRDNHQRGKTKSSYSQQSDGRPDFEPAANQWDTAVEHVATSDLIYHCPWVRLLESCSEFYLSHIKVALLQNVCLLNALPTRRASTPFVVSVVYKCGVGIAHVNRPRCHLPWRLFVGHYCRWQDGNAYLVTITEP